MDKKPLSFPSSLAPLTPTNALQSLFDSRVDTALGRLTRILSTPAGIDTTLTLLGYTSSLISSQLSSLQALQQRLLIYLLRTHKVLPATLLLPPARTVIAFSSISTHNSSPSALSSSLSALSALCSDFRTFTRLWGLLDIYQAARNSYFDPPRDEVLKWTGRIQNATLALYLFFENGYYLAEKGVLRGWGAQRIRLWMRHSLRCFVVWIGVEFVRLWRVWRLREERRLGQNADKTDDGAREIRTMEEEEDAAWRRRLLVNTMYMPIALHWAGGSGLLSENVVGSLMTLVGWIKFRTLWAQTL